MKGILIEHIDHREHSIQGRYLNLELLKAHCFSKHTGKLLEIGKSVKGDSLYALPLGRGKSKVLMWSQMHGNESTTTKALWDMINFLNSGDPLAETILSGCSLMIIPMLNPDGAMAYTRENFNGVDLNRDALALSQPESKAIRQLFEDFKPDHCFNLHDQRTLFSAGRTGKPATVSFLSPASDEGRELTPNRETAMKIIAAMDAQLQKMIPGQLGRFDDGYNANCIGDTFQGLGVPTILFEAGHYPGDYHREKTREYIFHALLQALGTIASDRIDRFAADSYFNIPENEKLHFDILIDRPEAIKPTLKGQRVGIRFRETLQGDKVNFIPEIAEVGPLEGFYGHQDLENLDSKLFELGIGREMIVKLLTETKI